MGEQSQIFTGKQQQQQAQHQSYTVPLSMDQSIDSNKRMFISQPLMTQNTEHNLIDDHDDDESVRVNLHDHFDDDDDVDLQSVHSAKQNIVHLSQHLTSLRQQVQSEE